MLLIDETGKQLGEVATAEALQLAETRGLDLLLVAPQARPPVAKLLDYGKHLYEQKRTARKASVAGKALETKGIRLGVRIGEHDLQVKIGQATKFLEKGHKIKITLQFRGREMAHQDLGFAKVREFAERLAEVAKLEQNVTKQGRQISALLAPLAKKAAK